MCQVVIPQTRVLSPRRWVSDPAEYSRYNPRTNAGRINDPRSPTDIPYGHSNAYGGLGKTGGFVAYESPTNPPPKDTIFGSIEYALGEAAKLSWGEVGSPPNPNIADAWRIAANQDIPNDGSDYPWCACFVSYILSKAGTEFIKTASSQAYANYGKAVNWRDYNTLRANDIVVFTQKADPNKGHVGFFKAVDPNTKIWKVAGGNQDNNFNIQEYNEVGSSLFVREVRRNWDIPADFDKPLTGESITTARDGNTR